MIKRLLSAAAALCCAAGLSVSAYAQMTPVTATSLKMSGVPISNGTATFATTNANGSPISVVAGGSMWAPQGFDMTITNGAIVGSYSVPDQCSAIATVPNTPVFYSVVITNTDTHKAFTLQAVQGICGTSPWALDHYAPTQNAVVSPTGIITGSTPPATCTMPSIFYTTTVPATSYKCIGSVFVQDTSSGGGGGGTSIAWRGAYNSATSYAIADAVSLSGSSYLALQTSTSASPQNPATATSYWGLLAAKGADGAQGTAGTSATPNTAAAPLSISGNNITIATATDSVPGALSAADHAAFNAKASAASVSTAQTAAQAFATAGDNAIKALTVNGKPLSSNPQINSFDIGATVGVIAGSSAYPAGTWSPVTNNAFNFRVPYVPPQDVNCVSGIWANASAAGETAGAQLNLKASIEYPPGTYNPIFFSGLRNYLLDGKAVLVSDPLCIDIKGGDVAYVRENFVRPTLTDTTGIAYNYIGGLATSAKLAPNTVDASGSYDNAEAITIATYTDGVSTGTTTFSSATAGFTAQYKGNTISVGGTTYAIASFVNATTITTTVAVPAGNPITFTTGITDKTLGGTILAATNGMIAPIALIGQTLSPKAVAIIGDSIPAGVGSYLNGATAATGSWAVQAISQTNLAAGKATVFAPNIPYVQSSLGGETCANLVLSHAIRYAYIGHVKKALGNFLTNDIYLNSVSAATAENCMLKLWGQLAARGVSAYFGTVFPHTTSTDGFLTAANQTVSAQEPVRLAVNNWYRDGLPYDCSTGLAAATGSTSATVVRANFYANGGIAKAAVAGASATCNHPALSGGAFELANSAEVNSSNVPTQDGGLWRADPGTRTLNNCGVTAGQQLVTCSVGTFTSGDTGRFVSFPGAAASGATLSGVTITFVSSTTANLQIAASSTVATGTGTLTVDGAVVSATGGRCTTEGVHPGPWCHALGGAMAAAAPVAQWTW